MKEIMEVIKRWMPRNYDKVKLIEFAQEIEEAFRDLYNQYLVAEKGAVDFFDWLDKREGRKPCINCGQTEGEIYIGMPHDHVCPDCGREKPYKILCNWCRKEPRIQGGELCVKCMKHLEDVGATYG